MNLMMIVCLDSGRCPHRGFIMSSQIMAPIELREEDIEL